MQYPEHIHRTYRLAETLCTREAAMTAYVRIRHFAAPFERAPEAAVCTMLVLLDGAGCSSSAALSSWRGVEEVSGMSEVFEAGCRPSAWESCMSPVN